MSLDAPGSLSDAEVVRLHFELTEDGNEEQAIAPMREASPMRSWRIPLLLYRDLKRKLPTIEEGGQPIVRLVEPDEDEGS